MMSVVRQGTFNNFCPEVTLCKESPQVTRPKEKPHPETQKETQTNR